MRRITLSAVAGLGAALAVAYGLSRPAHVDPIDYAGLTGDAAAGARVFWAAGCASCHTAPDATPSDTPVLAGGKRFETAFGTFLAPNISSDPTQGIGAWSVTDLASALIHGTSPQGRHYYPALPYAAYENMRAQDVVDLAAFLQTLPANPTPSAPHEVGFPFNINALLAGWKMMNTGQGYAVPDTHPGGAEGRYLVEALGHCAECHTPRGALGGLDRDAWMTGAPDPAGQGRIPSLVETAGWWSEEDIATYLSTGFTPDFDSAGGDMADVVDHLSRLPPADIAAIAAYVSGLAAR